MFTKLLLYIMNTFCMHDISILALLKAGDVHSRHFHFESRNLQVLALRPMSGFQIAEQCMCSGQGTSAVINLVCQGIIHRCHRPRLLGCDRLTVTIRSGKSAKQMLVQRRKRYPRRVNGNITISRKSNSTPATVQAIPSFEAGPLGMFAFRLGEELSLRGGSIKCPSFVATSSYTNPTERPPLNPHTFSLLLLACKLNQSCHQRLRYIPHALRAPTLTLLNRDTQGPRPT
jgi:hypothetical protein